VLAETNGRRYADPADAMKIRLTSDKLIIFSYFTSVILVGTFVLILPGAYGGKEGLTLVDALFTATSAVCVTGLTTVGTDSFSLGGQAAILVMIQLGGLGLITFTTLLIMVPRRKISLFTRGIVREFSIDEIEHDPRRIMRNIINVTLAAEAVGALSLWIAFARNGVDRPLFSALFHSVSAFCNAGFSTFSRNLKDFVRDSHVVLTIAVLVVIGGLGFVVVEDVFKVALRLKRRLAFYSGTVLRTTAFLILSGWAFFTLAEWAGAYAGLEPGYKVLAGFFQSITPRTAGFDTIAQDRLSSYSILITMILMYVGGSSGSTAGGIKTSTFFILAMLALKGTEETNGSLPVRGRSIPSATILKAIQISIKALMIILTSVVLLCFAEAPKLESGSLRLIDVIFEAFSAFGTVGLCLGITPGLSAAGKLNLIATMYAGRVGLVAMALPRPGRRMERLVDFASADHIVG